MKVTGWRGATIGAEGRAEHVKPASIRRGLPRAGEFRIGADVRYHGAAMSWEDQAENWLAWARTPGHDAYWSYRDLFFRLLPAPGRRTLEVGCGEGRVARDLAARGHRVV